MTKNRRMSGRKGSRKGGRKGGRKGARMSRKHSNFGIFRSLSKLLSQNKRNKPRRAHKVNVSIPYNIKTTREQKYSDSDRNIYSINEEINLKNRINELQSEENEENKREEHMKTIQETARKRVRMGH